MKKTFTILIAAIAAILMIAQPGKVMGQTRTVATTTFKSGSSYSAGMTLPYETGGLAWVTSEKPNGYESASPNRGIQYSKVSTDITHTISNASVTKVVVVASTNANDDVNNIKVYVGSTQLGTTQNMPKENNKEYTFEVSSGSLGLSGEIKVSMYNNRSKSTYIKSIAVTYTTTHTLTYSASDGGSITSVKYGNTSITSNTPVAEGLVLNIVAEASDGYNFDGWTATGTGYSFGDASATTTTFTMGTTDCAIIATFEESGGTTTYSVTYNANGGSGSMTDENSPYEENDEVTLLANTFTAPAGYGFNGWAVTDGSSNPVEVNNNKFTMPASNVTVTAQWQAYTITAQSNNTNFGTVTKEGFVITGHPVSGYRYATPAYTVSPDNSATVEHNGNDFTVTPTANTTITINFEAIPTHTATFSINGNTSQTATVAEGAHITFPSNPTDISGKKFVGWYTAEYTNASTAPSYVNTANTTMGNSNVTYYAVFATVSGSTTSANMVINTSTQNFPTSYGTANTFAEYSLNGKKFQIQQAYINGTKIQWRASGNDNGTGTMYNSDAINKIQSIVLLYASDDSNKNFTVQVGTSANPTSSSAITPSISQQNTSEYTFNCSSGNYDYFVLTNGSGAGYLTSITINYLSEDITYSNYCTSVVVPTVATPQFEPTAETFNTASLSVTLSCDTDGATIRYTTNGDEPTSSSTVYSSAISINTTTTIKAKAFKDENESAIATKTYTKVYNVTLSSNGVAGEPIEVVSGQSTTLTAPSNIPAGFSFRGWTATPATPSTFVNNTYTPSENITLYAVFGKEIYGDFIKVTSAPSDWSGYYLIVYETNNIALDGSLSTLNKTKNTINVTIETVQGVKTISSDATTNASRFTFSAITGGYSIRSASGYYIGRTANSNGLDQHATTAYINTIASTTITSSAGPTLQCWAQGGNNPDWKIGYYSSSQNAIQLYKQEVASIDGYYTRVYPSNATATGAIDVSTSGPIVIENGGVLDMSTYTLICTDPTKLIIEDGAQLILKDDNNSVAATIKKDIAAGVAESRGDAQYWYAISSPVNDAKIAGENANTNLITGTTTPNRYDLYRYNETAARWENYKAHNGVGGDFLTLENGRGYLYRNESDLTITFTGTVNTAASYTVTAAGPTGYTGFNLIGNPYTHEIYKGGAFPNSVPSSYTLANGFYKLNPATGGWVPGTDGETQIAPNEGFLVQATTGGTITIDNTVAKTRYNNEYLQFTVANSEYEDVAYALFDEGLGLSKINHRNADIPMLYINQDGKNYAIATMSDNAKSFNLNFKAMSTGKYTLSYKATGEYNYLHIIDRLTGADVDMLLEGEYSFIATPNDNENRFIVRLEYMPNYSEGNNEIFAFQNGNEILVSGEGELQIFDVTGRSVMTTTISGAESINLSAQGVYIFRLVGSEIKTQKIVVR